jgi:hypothetical protein
MQCGDNRGVREIKVLNIMMHVSDEELETLQTRMPYDTVLLLLLLTMPISVNSTRRTISIPVNDCIIFVFSELP